MFQKIFLILLSVWPVNSLNGEITLRNNLFSGYNKYVRPIKNYNDSLDVSIGLAVQNIESFDQIKETIELNVWLRKYWNNNFLKWDKSSNNITQLTLSNNHVWTPDIELVNAATIPDIYTLTGGMYLYPNGDMLWSMPAIYKFSCPLKLKFFPFDTQTCSMKFSSWSYDESLLKLSPYGEKETQIDVLDSFSHSEWEIRSYNVETYREKRKCCPDKLFNINKYNFKLKRYTHYYVLNMGMTISLVIVSFIIMMVNGDNLSRTGTAVFIPLTILALELTIAGKIPVVGYYTLMDIFFLTCFITSMIVSIESGIVYILTTSRSTFLYKIFAGMIHFEDIIKKYEKSNQKSAKRKKDHDDEYSRIKQNQDGEIIMDEIESKVDSNKMDKIDKMDKMDSNKEFDGLISILEKTSSYSEAIKPKIKAVIKEIDEEPQESIYNEIVGKDVIKAVDYNDRNLSITFKEYLIFWEIRNKMIMIDNICRVLLPIIFFTIIIVIFSYK